MTARARTRWLVGAGALAAAGALAREFVRRGARVALLARDAATLRRAREELEARGGTAIAIPCDVTDEEQAAAAVREVERRLGPVDVLVNNAGSIQVGPFDLMTRRDFEASMAVHYWGAFHMIMAVLPAMKRRRGGRIVNVASIGGRIGVPHLLPYCVGKFALVGLSEGLRAEVAKDGVLVTTVCPGLMRTGSPANARFKGRHRLEYAWFALADALPFLATSAEKAARRIVDACRAGEADVVLTIPGVLAGAFHGLFPGVSAELMAAANRLLPSVGGIGERSRSGRESESVFTRAAVPRISREAERRNNELP